MFKTGPFTVTMTCTKTASGTTLNLFGSSTEANSIIDGTLVRRRKHAEGLTFTDLGPTPQSTTPQVADDVNIDFEAPSGAQALLIGADGVNSLNADCWANWAGIH